MIVTGQMFHTWRGLDDDEKVWYGGGYICWWCRQQHEWDNPYGDWPPWLTLMISKTGGKSDIPDFNYFKCMWHLETIQASNRPGVEGHDSVCILVCLIIWERDTHFALINFICWWSAHWSRNRRLSTISAVLWILVYLIIWAAHSTQWV